GRDRRAEERTEREALRRQRLERGGSLADGATPLPCALPARGAGRKASLPPVHAVLRRVSGGALQHRLLRAAHAPHRAGDRLPGRRARHLLLGSPPLPEPRRAGDAAAKPRALPAANAAAEPGGEG